MFLKKLINQIDKFAECTGKLMGWLSIIVVLLMAAIVVLRYAFNIGSIALQESVIYFHSAVFLLGSAYTLKHNEHVRVDLFYAKFSARGKAWVNLLGSLLLLLPVSVFILVMSWSFVLDSWQIMEASNEAGGLPFIYILKSFIPLFCLFLIIQAVAEAGKAWLIIKAGPSPINGDKL
ncbi:TRAP transporter small permease subunit [Catenovulum sp. 2E275]|uniref:TRAP transporter small permease subunit n=1 Tax=Catenovulum sp. 2E275 TaxID=2980497 RepID=UPI0021D1BCE1|nr:TRAP transporter small permease subunit [Catenovulum sp. 2E275]MCU4674909.1 TRAP transporter small permease subunit [Catenovulum sp. 2E275]